MNLFNTEEFKSCESDADQWETEYGEYVRSHICCKPIKEKKQISNLEKAFQRLSPFIQNSLEEIVTKQESYLCVLPKEHSGKCCKNPHMKMFNGGLSNKFNTGIYSTPGNDDIIFKNRASRLFPIAIANAFPWPCCVFTGRSCSQGIDVIKAPLLFA